MIKGAYSEFVQFDQRKDILSIVDLRKNRSSLVSHNASIQNKLCEAGVATCVRTSSAWLREPIGKGFTVLIIVDTDRAVESALECAQGLISTGVYVLWAFWNPDLKSRAEERPHGLEYSKPQKLVDWLLRKFSVVPEEGCSSKPKVKIARNGLLCSRIEVDHITITFNSLFLDSETRHSNLGVELMASLPGNQVDMSVYLSKGEILERYIIYNRRKIKGEL